MIFFLGVKMNTRNKKLAAFIGALILILNLTSCKIINKPSLETFTNDPLAHTEIPEPEDTITPRSKTVNPIPKSVNLVEYIGPKYHVFFHSLIAFPYLAYSKAVGNGAFDTDCITPEEFKKTLEQLYDNNYMLIDIHSNYDVVDEDGVSVAKDKKLMFPEGKKPLVMSVDDMVYDPKKMGLGMVDKIILDASGNFASYTKMINGKEIISYDNEIIPILEQFIKDHPDFSFNGAKATLAVTGWVGILGYRIDRLEPNRQNEIDSVKPLILKLKENGWSFASHSYGHRHSAQISYGLFADDTEKWHKEIEPIVGPTDVYVYPYGEKLSVTDPKYKLLLNYGFKLICGVGSDNAWINYGNSIVMNRHAIDGYSLRNYHNLLLPFLDTEKVFDSDERKIY
jgi:hypothetical protein